MDLRDAKIDGVGVRPGRGEAASEHLFGIALGGDDLGRLLTDIFRQAALGRRKLLQRHVVLARQTALSIAFPAPSLVFGVGLFGVVLFKFGYQSEGVTIEFRLGDGQCWVAAYQDPGGGIGRQAIEIRIGQYLDSFFRLLQQTDLDRFDPLVRNALLSKNSAARIAVPDPLRVLLDREAAVRKPVQPVLDRGVQLGGDGAEFGVAAEYLFCRVPERRAMIVVEQRKRLADRSAGIRRGFRMRRMREANLDRNNSEHNSAHPDLRSNR